MGSMESNSTRREFPPVKACALVNDRKGRDSGPGSVSLRPFPALWPTSTVRGVSLCLLKIFNLFVCVWGHMCIHVIYTHVCTVFLFIN